MIYIDEDIQASVHFLALVIDTLAVSSAGEASQQVTR